ncbi:capsular polysaccharide biosynthesis protein [Halomonas organivorans]|uniref:Capsular polysaccharide export protein n=2 Tax=Halomonas organivorans TaxID=257772 RepID=A0A7W5C1I6_9GAMM|nr:capsular polysaccharide export protein [Halomonas organivorans]
MAPQRDASTTSRRQALVATRRMLELPTLRACLTEFDDLALLRRGRVRRADAILGWGLKPSAAPARRLAERHERPYVAVEDGFLRSWGLGVQGHAPHSLVVDHRGIYYDATRPSDLEQLILEARFDEAELERADRCMAQLRQLRLSKYNHAPDRALEHTATPRVLVVDQTAGDASIPAGLANADSFRRMLDEVLHAHPDAEILVKVHPDVIAGKKDGHLADAARHPRCRLIGEDLNPWALLDAVDSVHVVTSQLGFEALLAGKRVVCHGMPFYAGWGLTEDRIDCPRRGHPRTLRQLFAAAYLRYARYANPYTGSATTLEATIDLIADQKRQQERLAGRWVTYELSGWKRGFVPDFLGAESTYRHRRRGQPPEGAITGERVLSWASRTPPGSEQACRQRGTPLWRMEDGFVRSVGLGVDLTRPLSLVLDARGIYYDAGQPSDLEALLQHTRFDDPLRQRAAALRQRLLSLKLTKYNVAGEPLPAMPDGQRRLLVPGQVESDASIAHATHDVRTNSDLVRAVRRANPDALLIYKPHPDVTSGARIGELDDVARALVDIEARHADIAALLDSVDEIHTMCSLAGFEGLLRERKVVTYGLPFYAGWGLTEDRLHCERRGRQLTLDELVAATLILYPLYVDPRSRQLCNAETAIALLEQQRARGRRLAWKTRLYRHYRNIFIGKH